MVLIKSAGMRHYACYIFVSTRTIKVNGFLLPIFLLWFKLLDLSLKGSNVFILQLLAVYTNLSCFCFLKTIPLFASNGFAIEQIETQSQESNSGPYGSEAQALENEM